MAYKRISPQPVVEGGTGVQSNTPYAVLCGGTTSTNPIQSIASVGTAGQVLTSNGAGALPTFQNAAGGITGIAGDSGGTATGPTVTMSGTTAASGGSVRFARSSNTITLQLSSSSNNTFLGAFAGNTSTGTSNIGIGAQSCQNLTSGLENVAVGVDSLRQAVSSQNNVCIGSKAGQNFTDSLNVAVGGSALRSVTGGSQNVGIGYMAGSSYTGTESNNIIIGALNSGTAGESNTIRLGRETSQNTCYLAGNVITTTSLSGATRTITAQSTSNTSNSRAAMITEVAGASAGDAYYQARIAAGQNWTWGLDNSDSDAYVLSASATLGTTNVMRVSTAGEINYPLQPAFRAQITAVQNNVTGDGTTYTVQFNTEIFDQNGDFDTGTYTFTAPVTGRYMLTASLYLGDIPNTTTFVQMNIVTSNRTSFHLLNTIPTYKAAGEYTPKIAELFDMDVGDTALVQVLVGGSTLVVDIQNAAATNFTGYLVA